MNPYGITEEQDALRRLCAAALCGKKIDPPTAVDWENVFQESQQQSVSLLAFQAMSTAPEDLKTFQKWKKFAFANLQNNTVIYRNHTRLHELLKKENIPYCILISPI